MKNFEIINSKSILKPVVIYDIPKIKTRFESLQKQRSDGYPKVTEIKSKVMFKSDSKNADYDLPWNNLLKNYPL